VIRVLVAFIIFVAFLIVLGAVVYSSYRDAKVGARLPPEVRALPKADQRHYLERVKAVRLLQEQLFDPTVALTERWKSEAREAIDRLYE
jgi:hypothetical protein